MGTKCFVCQVELSSETGPNKRTLEHLIPQWIIRKYGLLEQTVTIPQIAAIPYQDFVLPCCFECNSILLAPIENEFSQAIRSWPDNPISEEHLARWIAKVVLGMQIYDRAARNDRSNPSSGEELSRAYLAGLRGKVQVTHRNQFAYPISVFWFRTKPRSDPRRNFDFQVSCYLQCMYLRLGTISMFGRIDAGFLRRHGSHFFQNYLNRKLAPLQVEELAAHFFAMAELSRGDQLSRKMEVSEGVKIIEQIELPRRSPFLQSDGSEFMRWFSVLTGAGIDELQVNKNKVKTFLYNEEGGFPNIDSDIGWH